MAASMFMNEPSLDVHHDIHSLLIPSSGLPQLPDPQFVYHQHQYHHPVFPSAADSVGSVTLGQTGMIAGDHVGITGVGQCALNAFQVGIYTYSSCEGALDMNCL